jgi:choline dehydrogenase-like flavoprotein
MRISDTEFDVIVAGSGPGGATVARELSRSGKKVSLIEKGKDHKFIGNPVSALFYVDRAGFLFSEEGLNIIRAITTGGSTILYCGSAAPAPEWLKTKYGIDITTEVNDTITELKIKPLPEELIGKTALRIMDSANELGYKWEVLPKFMDPARCKFNCSASCMMGCTCGAKWTAREYIKQAVDGGAKLFTETSAEDVLIQNGECAGLIVKQDGLRKAIKSKITVIAAGGLGTPIILQRAGISDAGHGFFCDPTVMVYGVSRERGTSGDPPMTVGSYEFYDSDGFMLSHLIDPWAMFPIAMYYKGLRYISKIIHYRKLLGIMIKVKDELSGSISPEGKISKPLTQQDRYRLHRAINIARKILIKSGADPDSIFTSPVRGTHPGGTARIGHVIDNNLETKIRNLFVCDASVFPEAPDRPLVLSIIGFGKRLAKYLFSRM